jgi:ElaB/YqjD/DUF883 family membrane-anchored ribosome-binding protein
MCQQVYMETYFDNMTAKEGSTQKLAQDLWILANDGKNLLADATQRAGEGLKADTQAANRIIRTNPYGAVAAAFGLGLLAGWLLGSRRS